MKSDLQKRPAKETCKIRRLNLVCQKGIYTYMKSDLQKRPAKRPAKSYDKIWRVKTESIHT